MKWLVLAFFAIAFVSSLLWIDSKGRRVETSRLVFLAATAMTGWAVVLLLGLLAV